MGQMISDNFIPMSVAEAERELHSGDFSDEMTGTAGAANLVPQSERVLLAYQINSQRVLFTEKRIILQTPDMFFCKETGNCMRFLPYSSIGGYAVHTPGSFDRDCEVELWTKCKDKLRVVVRDFARVNPLPIWSVLQLLNDKVLPDFHPYSGFQSVVNWDPSVHNDFPTFWDLLGSNMAELDPREVQRNLQQRGLLQRPIQGAVKVPETVVLAFDGTRNLYPTMAVFTNKRFFSVGQDGFSGKRYAYESILYEHIRLFSFETAGTGGVFTDRDSTLQMFTDLPGKPVVSQDFKANVDIKKIGNFLMSVTCGNHDGHISSIQHARNIAGTLGGGTLGPMAWLTRSDGNAGQIDAGEADAEFHRQGVLQPSERVEMGFKGKKDYFLFTTKRVLFVDNKKKGLFGSHGSATEYMTIPYHSISHFAVQTPGGRNFLGQKDGDCEVQLWTDSCCYKPAKSDGEDHKPPKPWVTFIELDLARDRVDLVGVHQYLSEKLMARPADRWQQYAYQGSGARAAAQATQIQRPELSMSNNMFDLFVSWATNDAQQVNPQLANAQMHQAQLLSLDEFVMLAFRCGRDLLLLTTRRIFMIDAQGFTGKKVQYLTIPYQSCRQFSVKSAGDEWSFDLDCELELSVRAFWNTRGTPVFDEDIDPTIRQDLARGHVDLLSLQGFLTDRVVLHYGASAAAISQLQNLPNFQNLVPPSHSSDDKGLTGLLMSALKVLDRDNFAQLGLDETRQLEAALTQQRILICYPDRNVEERVELAFRNRKDFILFTNLRLFHIDFTARSFFKLGGGNKIEYKSMPWGLLFDQQRGRMTSNLLAFTFETAQFTNRFDLDSTMTLHKQVTKLDGKIRVDIQRGRCDFGSIARWLTSKLVL
ncbi:unnamed protein product [Amoebophrya sp. A120]|nr:unnamed protein product [Amoebophrya sp. A120]|eukprot:GSA120T00004347001.1